MNICKHIHAVHFAAHNKIEAAVEEDCVADSLQLIETHTISDENCDLTLLENAIVYEGNNI